MGLIKEPLDIDFTVESKPWTERELADFRELIRKQKAIYKHRKLLLKGSAVKKHERTASGLFKRA